MKVTLILFAIAVASVSANKPPAAHPITLESEPAVGANLNQATSEARDSALHVSQAAVDAGRHLQNTIVTPTAGVFINGGKSASSAMQQLADQAVADALGASSAVQEGTANMFKALAEFLYNRAAANSAASDRWAGASEEQQKLASERAADAAAPFNNAVENVQAVATAAKEKAVEIKEVSAEQARAAEEDARQKAAEVKQSTATAPRRFANFLGRKASRVEEQVGAATETVGDKLKNQGGALKEDGAQRREELEQEHIDIVEVKRSSAYGIAAPSAAFAVAVAAAAYLI